jgi:PAP2 superfamily
LPYRVAPRARENGRIESYTPRPVRSRVIRTAAWGVVAAGVMAPLLRKRLSTPPIVAQTVAFAAPVGLCVATPRTRARDVAVCCLQMWAYLAAYKAPHDDEAAQEQRVLVDYPIVVDRMLGLGELPTVRLQRRLALDDRRSHRSTIGQWRLGDRVLVWAHWLWFLVPHGSLVYVMLRHRSRFERAAVMTYAVFDIGAMAYWILPTAPPWYAASHGGRGGDFNGRLLAASRARGGLGDIAMRRTNPTSTSPNGIAVRRMMVEYGEFFWKDGWGPLYSVLGGNPLAAMPSQHFATSMMAAQLLEETGPLAGALGWGYTATLGFALVYLGEHYVVDLLAGAALATAVRRLAPLASPALVRFGAAVAALEAAAHDGS